MSNFFLNCLLLVNKFFPVIIELFCLFFKLFILFSLFKNVISAKRNKIFFYLIIILATGACTNISLIFIRLGCPPFEFFPPALFRGIARLEGVTLTLQFYVLLCFFMSLSSKIKNNKFLRFIKFFYTIFSAYDMVFYLIWSIYTLYSGNVKITDNLYKIAYIHNGCFLIEGFIALFIAYKNYKSENINILKHHIFTLGTFFMFPYMLVKISESYLVAPKITFASTSIIINFPATSITSILLTAMIYYCARKLIGLRFLNLTNHVQSKPSEKYNFIDDFKEVLAKLGTVSSVEEVCSITKSFFYAAFKIPAEKVELFFKDCRFCTYGTGTQCSHDSRKLYIEKHISATEENSTIIELISSSRILILDEIELTHFYNQQSTSKDDLTRVVEFLKNIRADILMPIYSDGKPVCYILVDRGARIEKFYTDLDRDEMLIYADYVGRIIYLLTHMNLHTMLQKERELKEELYAKQKNIELIKKCMFNFLGSGKTRKVGVLTYKNKKFAYCNQVAKQLLKIDLNSDKGLDITQILSQMGHDTSIFMASKREVINSQGEKLIAISTPNVLKSNAIITISNPTIADIIKDDLGLLKDPNKWEFLLALRSTEEGETLNQLLPSDSPSILNCKISLFEYSEMRKTVLLDLPSEDDYLSFAHVAHRISKRQMFEEITLKRNFGDEAIGMKIFGINPIFKTNQEEGLLSSLNSRGTLLINNIQFLSLQLQQRLLEFIVSGKYRPLKSDEKVDSDVFLICSTNQNLQDLVAKGLFLEELYFELQKTSVWLPPLRALPEDEFLSLAEGLRKQIIQSKVYQNMLSFTEQDKSKLLGSGCVSLYEIKNKIQNILIKRTRRHVLDDETIIDPACQIADLDLVDAARLGKQALKDPKLVAMLLTKFKNNQAKVASFLGVNRSTISRRCAQFGLDAPADLIKLSSRKDELKEG